MNKFSPLLRPFWLLFFSLFFLWQIGGQNKWRAFETNVNDEVYCTNDSCTRSPEWKNDQIFFGSNNGASLYELPVTSTLNPKLCIQTTGTGVLKIMHYTINLSFVDIPPLISFPVEPKLGRHCFSIPSEQMYALSISEISYNDEEKQNIDAILSKAEKEGMQGTHDELLEDYSFKVTGTYALEIKSVFLLWLGILFASYISIEILQKFCHWLETGKHNFSNS